MRPPPAARRVCAAYFCIWYVQVFDAGEKLFIALVDIADSEEDEGEASAETTTSTTTLPRKVVVRDDYVQDGGGEVFLVDREFLQQ